MGSESIDVFDELGQHRGVLERAAAHADGWWHQAFHLLIVARRPDGPSVVLQRRAHHKTNFPGLIDLTATGHLEAGEQPIDGLRELHEELGVELDPSVVAPLGVRRVVDATPEGINREFCHVFLAADDRPLDAYRPDPDEVSAVVEVAIDSMLDLVTGRASEVRADQRTHDGDRRAVRLSRADLVPDPPLRDIATVDAASYWCTIVTMAERFAGGETRLSI